MQITTTKPSAEPERGDVQQLVHSRIALRFGLSLPVAAAMAAIHGIGPEAARRAAR